MKECSRCLKDKPLDHFHSNPFGRMGRHSVCADCTHMRSNSYYERNKEKIKARAKAFKQKRYQWYIELKESTPCSDCGNYFPYYVTDYDHLPGTQKIDKVSRLMQRSDDEAARIEIAKCELVCANCHRIRTHTRRQYTKPIDED